MYFWIFMLVMDLLIPGSMIVLGWLFLRRPPRNINNIYGYRTARSMKSAEAWRYAHHYFGRLWLRFGIALLIVSVIVMLGIIGRNIDTVGYVGGGLAMLQCVVMMLPIIPTEKELKRRFGEEM
ncbi:SdpI family protein [Lachnospiraceae bacterium]|nr:SdpI family protein [Lachnospiraceae bacterium]